MCNDCIWYNSELDECTDFDCNGLECGVCNYERGGKMKTTKAQKDAVRRYDATHTKQIMFKFNLETDADILAKLDEVENKQGYIKELIRADIERASR